MAWCPFARKLELQPESDNQAAIKPTQFIVHSIAAPWKVQRVFEYWRDSTNLESHFGLAYDGDLGQFIGTETRADANASANVRAVSLETASDLKHIDPWTPQQVEKIIELGVWLHKQHGIPLRLCRTAADPGFGWHSMFPEWSVGGTACPGAARIKQFKEVVFPEIVRRAFGATTPPKSEDVVTPEDIEKIAKRTAQLVWEYELNQRNGDWTPTGAKISAHWFIEGKDITDDQRKAEFEELKALVKASK